MKNRNEVEDAMLTPRGQEVFLGFVSIIDVRVLSKGLRDQHLFYARMHAGGYPLDWAEFLLHLDSLFNFLDSIEDEYF